MDKALLYARVSSKDQEAEGYSIPAQIKLLREYSSYHDYLITREFVDVETAKKAGRTQFSAMISFIQQDSTIKHLLVEKTDRLLRNISDYALLDKLIEHSNITIHLVKENVILSRDSRSNEKFVFGIRALMAKNYIDNLSEEVRKGMIEKAEQGIYPSTAPYGYINAQENGKKIITIDPQAALYVKKMFELYATGSYSLPKLRKKMIADGMIYRNGKNFYVSKIETILKNEFYAGVFFWRGKKYINASHEPIVTKELFQRVQDILINPHKSKSRKGIFPYTNLIRYGICKCSLTAEIKKEKYIYYHCTGHKGNCKQPYLKQIDIEKAFEELLSNIQVSDETHVFILQGLRDSFKDKVEYHNNLVSQIEKQIKVLQNRIDQAYLDKLDQKITEKFWLIYSRKWFSEKEQLTTKLLAIQQTDSRYLENINLILELSKKALQLFKNQNVEQKRRMITLLVSNCSYKDGSIDIQLHPAFEAILKSSKNGKWCARQESNL